jgi:preprotein translocase subunit YajC
MDICIATLSIWADEAPVMQSSAPQGASALTFFLPLGVMVLFLIFSSRKQKQLLVNMLANLKKNDKVETSSGIFGTIVAIKDNNEDEVTLRTDDTTNTRIRIRKSTIIRVFASEEENKAEVKS